MKLLAVLAIATALLAQTDQKTNQQNMVRDRGQTPVADETQTLDRGRIGHQDALPKGILTIMGMLVDGGCEDRSSLNLRQRPEPAAPAMPVQPPAAAPGIRVDAATVRKERADALEHQVPDMRTRENDPTCAITGASRSFAVLMANGRLLNLDEGGNTLAQEALRSDADGRAMLNGYGPGLKPAVSIEGRIHGDRLIVDKILKFGR